MIASLREVKMGVVSEFRFNKKDQGYVRSRRLRVHLLLQYHSIGAMCRDLLRINGHGFRWPSQFSTL